MPRTFTASERIFDALERCRFNQRNQPAIPASARIALLTDAPISELLFQFSLVLIGEKNGFLSREAKFF